MKGGVAPRRATLSAMASDPFLLQKRRATLISEQTLRCNHPLTSAPALLTLNDLQEDPFAAPFHRQRRDCEPDPRPCGQRLWPKRERRGGGDRPHPRRRD